MTNLENARADLETLQVLMIKAVNDFNAKEKEVERLAALENPPPQGKRFKPAVGQEYWFLNSQGQPWETTLGNFEDDLSRHALGNCYSSRYRALLVALKRRLEVMMRDWDVGVVDWSAAGQDKRCVYYDHFSDGWRSEQWTWMERPGAPHFTKDPLPEWRTCLPLLLVDDIEMVGETLPEGLEEAVKEVERRAGL